MGRFMNYVLGGSTSPVAGDGYGYNPPSPTSPTKSPMKSLSIAAGKYFTPSEPKVLSSPKPHELSPIHLQELTHSPNGVGTPRSPHATNPEILPRLSAGPRLNTSGHPDLIEAMRVPDEIMWQDYEIPKELGSVKDDMPSEIRNIVQESLDEHQAMRASLIQARSSLVATTTDSLGIQLMRDTSTIAESSAMTGARSKLDSMPTRGSLKVLARSDSSPGSNIEDSGRINPPPPEVTTEYIASLSHSLLKLLPTKRSKGETPPSMLSAEPTMNECTSCFDEVPKRNAVKLPCRHSYCRPCFAQLISTSIEYEINFPPKCCLTDVPKKIIQDNLSHADCAAFNVKALEYAVPVSDRYYCVSSTCGRWIDTRHAKRTTGALKCPHCAVKLCTLCRGPQHPSNRDCPQDSSLRTTLEQAKLNGWRRCYRCKAMVELNTGCRHITCKCRAEFCYTCGAKWGTCSCTEHDQYRRAERIRTRLAQFEADQRVAEQARRAEEERVRAAAAAVEAAERRLREEREAEEARMEQEIRELARKETERVQQITEYFQYLRGVLQRVQSRQRFEIEERHDQEWTVIDRMRAELDSHKETTKRDTDVKAERDKIEASTETTLKGLQRQHAANMMDIITHHRKEQDKLLAQPVEPETQDVQTLKAEKLQDLTAAQDLERAKLRSQQADEIQKWKSRGKASLQAFDSRMLAVKMRLEAAERISKREEEIRDLVFAEGKWAETLFEVRYAMLAEDERRITSNGGEVPAVPKREVVGMSAKESPTMKLQTKVSQEVPNALVGLLMKEAHGRPVRCPPVVLP